MAIRNLMILALLALMLVMLSTTASPLWGDEFLHFAFASYDDTIYAIRKIIESTHSTNHGQTGVHILLNYFLLKVFGASYWVLRLPSYLAALLGLLAGVQLLSRLGISSFVQIVFLLALGLSELNLDLAWQARPYILLQASVLCFLWSWQRYVENVPRALLVVFLVSLAGILFHPFFVLYAALIVIGDLVLFPGHRATVFSKLRSLDSTRPILLAAALLAFIYLLNAKLTWLQTFGSKMSFDPYEWIKNEKKPLPIFMAAVFFQPFGKIWMPLSVTLFALMCWKRNMNGNRKLLQYLLLLLMVIGISQAVIVLSTIRSNYWILQRQWIAGNALAYLASAMLLEGGIRWLALRRETLKYAAVASFLGGLILLSLKIRGNLDAKVPPPSAEQAEELLQMDPEKLDVDRFVTLARRNLEVGGKVWPIFQRYYGR